MAGDWIKVEASTPDKPEVIGIADMLGIPPTQAFGALFMVWRWFDQHTTEGNASFVTKVTVDRLSGVTGFADAMQKVGWLSVDCDGSISLPHFDRHNGETAKQRGLTAKRVAKSKAKSNASGNDTGNAQVTVGALPREEKRREEVDPLSEQAPVVATTAPPAKPTASIRGSRLPADFVLPKAWGDWALEERPDWTADDVRAVADKFRDHWVAKSGRDASKVDWQATWRNWVRGEAKPKGQVVGFIAAVKAPEVCCVCGSAWQKKIGGKAYCGEHDQYSGTVGAA